jgi:hypothetical protein
VAYEGKCKVCGKPGETLPHRIHKHDGVWTISLPGDTGTNECCRDCWHEIWRAFKNRVEAVRAKGPEWDKAHASR